MQMALAKEKAEANEMCGCKERALTYHKYIKLAAYESQIVSQKLLELMYFVENPAKSYISSRPSLFEKLADKALKRISIIEMNPKEIEENLKKDYQFLVEIGCISEDVTQQLCRVEKGSMDILEEDFILL